MVTLSALLQPRPTLPVRSPQPNLGARLQAGFQQAACEALARTDAGLAGPQVILYSSRPPTGSVVRRTDRSGCQGPPGALPQ